MKQDLSNVKYVGPSTIARLAEHGITTVEQLAAMSAEQLAALPGIGASTAPLILASANDLLHSPIEAAAPEAESEVMEVEPAVTDEPTVDVALIEEILIIGTVDVGDEKTDKKQQKEEKKAKKARKKAEKEAKKQVKEAKKAARKQEKKAEKEAKKLAKKASKKDAA